MMGFGTELLILMPTHAVPRAAGVADAEEDMPVAQLEQVRAGAVFFRASPVGVGVVQPVQVFPADSQSPNGSGPAT